MRMINWGMMNMSVMGNAVSALHIVWKHRYISDDQWEMLYWEFFCCCSFVWKYPIHIAAFFICAPRLVKVLLFFYPLLISTVLFLLIVFSLGPQLERMRADRDIQWQRFREAAVSDEDSSGDSWACQQPYGKLGLPRAVNGKMEKGEDDWVEWTKSLEKLDGSIYYTEEHSSIEKDDKNVDFGNAREEKIGHDGGPIVVSSKSLILGKVRELMERLIDELGGRVELDALNALESITQVLIESTGRDYQKQGKYSCPFSMRKTEYDDDLSDDEQFQKTLFARDCELVSRQGTVRAESLEHAPCENINASRDDEKEGKNSSFLAKAEAEYKQSDDLKLHYTGYVGQSEFLTGPDNIENQNIVGLDHAPGISKDEEEQGEKSIFISTEDELSDDGHFQTGYVGNSELTARPKNVMSTCIEQDNAFPVSRDEATSVPVQEREQKADGISGFGQSEFRTCRSLSVEALKEEFRCTDELWEAHDDFREEASVIGKAKDWKQILSNNYNGDLQEHYQHSSSSVRIPEHKNKQHNVLAGKLRCSPSEPNTFIKRPQILASPVMLLGTADMDLLWEKYNDASLGAETLRKEPIADLDGDLREIVDSDAEDLREASQVCCLQAFKISKGKMPLRKPSLKKISKALKKLGLLPQFRSRKTA